MLCKVQNKNIYLIFYLFRGICSVEKAQNFGGYFLCLKVVVDTRAQDATLLSFLFMKFLEFTRRPQLFLNRRELFAIDELHQRVYIRIEASGTSLYQHHDIARVRFGYAVIYMNKL